MGHRVEFEPGATRDLGRLPAAAQAKLRSRIEALAETPRPAGAKKLSDSENLYRIRVGIYRVVYDVRDRVLLVMVVRVAKRGRAY